MLGGGDGLNVMPRMDLHHTIPRKYPMASLKFLLCWYLSTQNVIRCMYIFVATHTSKYRNY